MSVILKMCKEHGGERHWCKSLSRVVLTSNQMANLYVYNCSMLDLNSVICM